MGADEIQNIQLTLIEQDIFQYILNHDTEDYDDILQNDERFKVFYHFAKTRRAILEWYDFNPNADLLEIGGEFGALTGLFCDKCKNVTSVEFSLQKAEAIRKRYARRDNLQIYSTIKEVQALGKKYDYVVMIENLEYVAQGDRNINKYSLFLSEIKKLLKSNGKILIAVENRYGLRYFCGAKEPHTGIPFHGLNHYPGGFNGYSFSRQELIRILEKAGYSHYRFYYPLPDYKFTQLVYSQDYLPKDSIRERIMPYYEQKQSLIMIEKELYDDIVENHAFEFMANSFLIESAQEQIKLNSAIYAAISSDRNEENAFATVIHNNSTVTKTPIYTSGRKTARLICKNLLELRERGVKIVEHEYQNNRIVMPLIKLPTLSTVMREEIWQNSDKFEKLFDKLYFEILRSSVETQPCRNRFLNPKNHHYNWGVILEKAYIDMVPINCFYNGKELYFFDQEFTLDFCPAKYVLFRALMYTYIFIPDANRRLPLNHLREKYEMTEVWSYFEKVEQQFITQNRNYAVYQQFMKWADLDRKQVHKNAESMSRSRINDR